MSAPEPSTRAMMLIGFAGLAFAGYRRAKAGGALKAHEPFLAVSDALSDGIEVGGVVIPACERVKELALSLGL
jgi:PEP-CTERM motif